MLKTGYEPILSTKQIIFKSHQSLWIKHLTLFLAMTWSPELASNYKVHPLTNGILEETYHQWIDQIYQNSNTDEVRFSSGSNALGANFRANR